MNKETENIIRLNRQHIKPAIETLTKAFKNYPLIAHYFPDDDIREKFTHYFIAIPVYIGMKYGEIYATSPNMEGIAVWIPSDEYRLTFTKMLFNVPFRVLFGFGRYGANKMSNVGRYIDETHERLVPYKHWYLWTVGVDPDFQGKGYSSKLIKPMLERMAKEGQACFLETHNEKNVNIYGRMGFKLIDKSAIPDTGLTNWAMLKES